MMYVREQGDKSLSIYGLTKTVGKSVINSGYAYITE